MTKANEEPVFIAGKAQWLLEHAQELSPGQRALLLAAADLDIASGRKISPEERAALDELAVKTEGFDPREIEEAVRHMVEAKSKRKTIEWPSGLYRLVRKKK